MLLASKVLSGMSVMGSIMSPAESEDAFAAKIQTMTNILTGLHDEILLCALVSSFTKNVPSSLDEVNSNPEALAGLGRLKDMIRRDIQMIMDKGAAEDKNNLLMKMKETNKPHPMGTVNEIAAKLNISKSEVRRLKANGSLDGLAAITSPDDDRA